MIKEITDSLIYIGNLLWIIPALSWFHSWLKQPIIEYGLFDHPYYNETHYFIIVRYRFNSFVGRFKPVDFIQLVTCNIVSGGLNLSGYKIKIRKWYERIGWEDIDETFIEPKIINKDHKIIFNFELYSNKLYRIIIKSDAGRVGSLNGDYILNIESKDITIKRSDYNLPK